MKEEAVVVSKAVQGNKLDIWLYDEMVGGGQGQIFAARVPEKA